MKKVKDVMTKNVKACRPNTSLAEAVSMMWDNDCGILPVVNDNDKVIGVITDRDICIALATKNNVASNVAVDEVMTSNVNACSPDSDIKFALATMQAVKVRRLPVIDDNGSLQGILSINDIVLNVEEARGKDLSYEDVVKTFKAICEHPTWRATATAV